MNNPHFTRHAQPRLVAERKPVRPVSVTSPRPPISVTQPIALGGQSVVVTPLVGRKTTR